MANLKAGTLIGGNLIWDAGNLPLRTTNNDLYIRTARVYTTEYNPTPAAVGAVNKAGDTMTGALTINNALTVGSPSAQYTTVLNGTVQQRTGNYGCRITSAGDRGYFQAGNAVDIKQPHLMSITGWSSEPLTNLEIKLKGGSIWFNSDSTISASVAPTGGSHLVNKAYADTKVAVGGSTMTGKLTLNYTSSVKVPVGNSSQRGTSVCGDFRFNTDEISFEGHDGNEWQPIGSGRVSYTMYTANFTAVRGKGHLVDTRNAGMVVTLPTNVRNSDFVVIGDGSKNASKNPFWVAGFNGDRLLVDRDNCILRFGYFGNKWIIEDGVGENGAINTGEFVARSGSVMSGKLTIEGRSSAGSFGVKRSGSTQFANYGQSGDSGGEVIIGVGPTAEDYSAYLKVGKDKLKFQPGNGGSEVNVYHEGEKPFKVHHVGKPSGCVDGKYYPVVIRNANNNQQVYINSRHSGGSDPMNCCSFDGSVRAMGWSDGISFAQGVFTIYHESERAIHSIVCNSESEGIYAFYVEARAFPLVVRIDSACSVNAYNADHTTGTTTYKAGVTAAQIDDASAYVKGRRLMNFDNGSGTYRTDGVRNDDSAKLSGPVNFDDYTTGRTYNLYGTQSGTNSPPFSYGTMIVVGRGNGTNVFVTQIATERGNRTTFTRTRNDNGQWNSWVKSYDEANKPTAAELGAVSLTADNGMTGILRIKNTAHNTIPAADEVKYDGYGMIGNRGSVYLTNASTSSNSQVQICIGGRHADNAKFMVYSDKVNTNVDLQERGQRVYSPNNKPTPVDIGAAPVGFGLGEAGLTKSDANELGAVGGFFGAGGDSGKNFYNKYAPLIQAFRSGGGDGSGQIVQMQEGDGTIAFRNRANNVWSAWTKLYSTNFKPTAAEVGALPIGGGTLTGALVVDANSAIPLTLRRSTQVGMKMIAGENTRVLGVDNSGNLRFGASDDHSGNAHVYTTARKPTAIDVGALPVDSAGYVTTAIETRAERVSMVSDNAAQHFWFKNSAGNERALIWHDSNNNLLQMRVGGASRWTSVDTNGVFSSHNIAGEQGCFWARTAPTGAGGGIIRGDAQAGSWANWRDRSSAVQLDCANVDAGAVNVWKATKWAAWHVAAMDVHVPGNIAEAQVSMHIGQNNNQFAFKANGQGYATAGWHTGSDSRFKENIKPISSARTSWLDKVCSLNASSFKYKISDKQSIGFIAQDVQKAIPEAISVQIDTTIPEAEREGTERLFIDPMAIIAAQNEAIKELRARLEALENK